MGTIIDNHPTLADGMNEKGLACAGLNFDGYSYVEENIVPGKKNIAPYDFIYWVVANHETVDEVKQTIEDLELVKVTKKEKTEWSGCNLDLFWFLEQAVVFPVTKFKLRTSWT